MRDPNFIIPKCCPGRDVHSRNKPTHDTSREQSNDLPADDRLALVVDPYLRTFVIGGRVVTIGWQKSARTVVDFQNTAAHRRPIHVDVRAARERC